MVFFHQLHSVSSYAENTNNSCAVFSVVLTGFVGAGLHLQETAGVLLTPQITPNTIETYLYYIMQAQ